MLKFKYKPELHSHIAQPRSSLLNPYLHSIVHIGGQPVEKKHSYQQSTTNKLKFESNNITLTAHTQTPHVCVCVCVCVCVLCACMRTCERACVPALHSNDMKLAWGTCRWGWVTLTYFTSITVSYETILTEDPTCHWSACGTCKIK